MSIEEEIEQFRDYLRRYPEPIKPTEAALLNMMPFCVVQEILLMRNAMEAMRGALTGLIAQVEDAEFHPTQPMTPILDAVGKAGEALKIANVGITGDAQPQPTDAPGRAGRDGREEGGR